MGGNKKRAKKHVTTKVTQKNVWSRENPRFDRIEYRHDNQYSMFRGTKRRSFEDDEGYEGFLKCKLVHENGFSIIVPDLLYLMDSAVEFSWIQMFSFMANYFQKESATDIFGALWVDIAFGHTLQLQIEHKDHVTNLQDHSNLFKCTIRGPKDLRQYATGTGKIINGIPYLQLYHHTTQNAKEQIMASGHFRGSVWNYQGTKQLASVCYAYFSSLTGIRKPSDLKMIAMAGNGKLEMIVDVTQEIISIPVYRDSTSNRVSRIDCLVDSTILRGNYIWMHTHDDNGTVYYEISGPFIFRVPLEPATVLPFHNCIVDRVANVKSTDHLILGDAATKTGLVAPLDEEHTTHVFKIEPFYGLPTNVLKFWFDNGDQDLYSAKKISKEIFKKGP
jgi:hypothetical protein